MFIFAMQYNIMSILCTYSVWIHLLMFCKLIYFDMFTKWKSRIYMSWKKHVSTIVRMLKCSLPNLPHNIWETYSIVQNVFLIQHVYNWTLSILSLMVEYILFLWPGSVVLYWHRAQTTERYFYNNLQTI